MKLSIRFKGGEGSGNFGHAGRPGKVGGSAAVQISFVDPVSKKPTGKTLSDADHTLINDAVADIHATIAMDDPEAIVIGSSGAVAAGSSDPFGRSTRIDGKNYIYIAPWRLDDPPSKSPGSTYNRAEWFGFSGANDRDALLKHVVSHEYGHLWWKQNSVKSADLVKLPGGSRGRVETNPVLTSWRDNVWREHRGSMSGYANYNGSYEEAFCDMFANFVMGEPMPSAIEDWFVDNVR
jgi:hypothetical protein